jgi:hypothetical protein
MGSVHEVGSLLSGIAAVAGIIGAVISLKIALAVQELRTYLEKSRREDQEKMEAWVEDRFVRRRQYGN